MLSLPLIHLASLLFSPLAIDIQLINDGAPLNSPITLFKIISTYKNISVTFNCNEILINNFAFGNISKAEFSLSFECIEDFQLLVILDEKGFIKPIISPLLCAKNSSYGTFL